MDQSTIRTQPLAMSPNTPTGDPNKPVDPATLRYLRAALDVPHPADEPFVLSERESRHIRQIHRQTLGLAALLGIIGMSLFYGPQIWLPALFSLTRLPWGDNFVVFPLLTSLYGLLLIYLEVSVLLTINLRAVQHIMAICQFPRSHDGQYAHHLLLMEQAARQQPFRGLLQPGIDAYLGMPHSGLNLFFAISTLKAILTDATARFLIRQLAGLYSLNQITYWLGLPILALWNVWASEAVLHEIRIRVMVPLTVREFVNELYEQWGQHAGFRSLILEVLHFGVVLTRQHNYAHLVLTEAIVHRFKLEPAQAPPTGHLLILLTKQPPDVRQSIERLLIFSMLIDGRLSPAEKYQLRRLAGMGWLTHTIADIEALGANYRAGKGLWV